MIDGWMVNIVIALIGAIGTYAVLNYRVKRLEEDFKAIEEDIKEYKKELDNKINSGFKKLDMFIDRVIVLEQNTKEHLGLREAEDKFVSHRELQLHLNNIEKSIQHVEKNSDIMTKKLEELTNILSTNIVKTLSVKGD